jgi:hypothetical protein
MRERRPPARDNYPEMAAYALRTAEPLSGEIVRALAEIDRWRRRADEDDYCDEVYSDDGS